MENLIRSVTVSMAGLFLMSAGPGKGQDLTTDLGKEIKRRAIPVRTIKIEPDDDFSDLEPIVDLIGDARVVVLGEATHMEGSASAAKARMVRFLHTRMGFDVLAWESGMFQCHAMNVQLRNHEVPLEVACRFLMAGGWATEKDTASR